MYFHQICLSEDPNFEIPASLKPTIQDTRSLFSDFRYKLWGSENLRDFISKNFSDDVLAAYDSLKPLAYKADLGRYCLMYLYGGWYADLTLKFLNKLSFNDSVNLLYFHDFGIGPPGPNSFLTSCQNGLIYAKPNHKVFERCIEIVVKHCAIRYYGLSSTCPTGPMVFGKALVEFTPDYGILPGYFMALTPMHDQRNLAYVSGSGEIVALHKSSWHKEMPAGGDLSAFGLSGTNNYNQLYRDRDIYR